MKIEACLVPSFSLYLVDEWAAELGRLRLKRRQPKSGTRKIKKLTPDTSKYNNYD
jgi:hypothetical protein